MKVVVTRSIRAPPARVFEGFTDAERFAGRISGVKEAEVVSEVRAGRGLRRRETRVFFGDNATVERELTACDAARSCRVESRVEGSLYGSTFHVTEDTAGGVTVVTWTHDSRAARRNRVSRAGREP